MVKNRQQTWGYECSFYSYWCRYARTEEAPGAVLWLLLHPWGRWVLSYCHQHLEQWCAGAGQTVLTRDPPPSPLDRLDRLVQCQQPPCIRLDWQPQWTNDVRTLLMTSMTVQGLHVPALRMRTVLFLWSPGGLSAARGGECSAMLDTDTEVPGLGC